MPAILAIDQGTHASRAVVFDGEGQILASAVQAIHLDQIDSTRVEQDANSILASVRRVVDQVLAQISVPVGRAALATQRSTLVAWDSETGEPLAPAISWLDRRAAGLLQRDREHAPTIHRITGLPLSPHYLAGKIKWLLEQDRAVREALQEGRLRMGPLAAFLCSRLLDGQHHVVDHSNASRSLLFDLRRLDWSPELLGLFGIPREILPDCRPTLSHYGHLADHDIALCCVCGDQNAAIHANGMPEEDTALINIGSGAFVLQACGAHVPEHPRLLGGIARSNATGVDYLLEGTVNGAGSALDTLRENETEVEYRKLHALWLGEVTEPPVCINTSGGLGSPWWVDQLEMRFIPATSDRVGRTVALLESILFLLQDNLEQMDQKAIQRIQISGGLSRLDGLCQGLADLSGIPVLRGEDREATARGAAWLASGLDIPWRRGSEPELFKPGHNPRLQRRHRRYRHELITLLGGRAAWYRQSMESARLREAPLLVAHRGYRSRYPENTLEAIEAAIEAGADAVEFDIQFSRDGEPMIFHDETLARTTGRPGQIFEYSRMELQEILIPTPGGVSEGVPIPALDQLTGIIAQHLEIRFFAEIKRQTLEQFGHERVMQRVLKELRIFSAQCVIISFDRECLEYVRRNSDMAIGWVLRHYDADHREAAGRLQPDYLIVNHEKLPMDERPWEGPWEWMVYEINDCKQVGHYHRLGVNYISTADVCVLKDGQTMGLGNGSATL